MSHPDPGKQEKLRGLAGVCLLGLLWASGPGCRTIPSDEFDALQRLSISINQAQKDYKIQPGDGLRVVVYRGAQVAAGYDQTIVVQPDGRITLVNLPTTLQAEALTVSELQDKCKEAYAPFFKSEPDLRVTVQFLKSEKTLWIPDQVYVTGEVNRAIIMPYRKGMTVMQAITQGGGWKYTGDESRVVILRMGPDGQTASREVNCEEVVAHSENDLELQSGDIVYVPLTTIAKINLFVEFYIRGLLPFSPSTIRSFFLW